ncbi:MAG: bifunctional 23S rRNA (guanine(2069)-N(7))-methyltransferase RlmK/23S rRNA (guanine(2445)-N(2))-methyltransferase RlmL, partial [Gammaproteobacteria bacterium]|nr:bifunctional 23S rRNA (guanine(2069)-N(7))-methyltransferase RlmK/23S rRNA (guanine(2445)-N(2))-methyltransferase RlmL [Gammaproteobacteria bacterium]
RDRFAGWRAAVFTGNPELGRRMTLGSGPATTLYNGALECRLFDFQIPAKQSPESPNHGVKSVPEPGEQPLSDGSSMLINRLRKNLKHTGRWARRNGISCYRLYDSDLPEYPMAVDVYSGTKTWVHVQEYAAPRSVDESRVEQRSREALVAIKQVLEVPGEQLFHKIRRKQKGRDQYEKLGKEGIFHEVREGECRLLVNFTDYLDTGLFPDHRITRKLIGELVKGKNFLNLFGYTGAATVHAAMGGAKSTTTVDLSPTYLDWAGRNLKLNGIGGARHRLIQEECVAWLEEQPWSGDPHRYGLIFLDPPTFSNSKKMDHDFDVQRDYVTLITQVSRLLDKDGLLIFSTNSRRFKLDGDELSGLAIRNITRETIPQDFKRRPKIHQCWQISKK